MKRRSFIKTSIAVSATSALMTSNLADALSQTSPGTAQEAGTIIHSVYFWLKPGLTSSEEKDFLNFFKALRKVPGVKSLTFGKPAPTTKRDVTDNTFSYNLILTFDTLAEIQVYETHPDHLKAAERYSRYWERVQVRDTVLG